MTGFPVVIVEAGGVPFTEVETGAAQAILAQSGLPITLVEEGAAPLVIYRPFDPATLFADGEGGAYFDPSDPSSTFQDDAGTIPAGIGDPVGRLADLSGNDNHLTQSTDAARPTLLLDSAGRRYLHFDGTAAFLEGPAISTLFTDATFDIMGACSAAVLDTDQASVYLNEGFWRDSDRYMGLHFKSTGLALAYNWDGSADTAQVAFGADETTILLGRHSGGNLSIAKGASPLVTAASGNTDTMTGLFQLGRGESFTDMACYGLIIRDVILDADELSAARGWLASKSGAEL